MWHPAHPFELHSAAPVVMLPVTPLGIPKQPGFVALALVKHENGFSVGIGVGVTMGPGVGTGESPPSKAVLHSALLTVASFFLLVKFFLSLALFDFVHFFLAAFVASLSELKHSPFTFPELSFPATVAHIIAVPLLLVVLKRSAGIAVQAALVFGAALAGE